MASGGGLCSAAAAARRASTHARLGLCLCLAARAACVCSHVQAHQQLLWRMSALGVVELAPSSLGFMYSKNRC
jgi:hypothetical protein